MKTEIPHRWAWRIVAGLWDVFGTLLVAALASILIVNGGDNRNLDEIIAGIVLAVFYPFALLLLQAAVTAPVYPWYLATNAQKEGFSQDYWFWKFRYRLPRYLQRILRGSKGELFVRLQVLRFAETDGKRAPPDPVPSVRDLLRAFRQKNLETDFLYGEGDRPGPMAAQVNALKSHVEKSGTYTHAYVSYLADLYLGFKEEEQRLIQNQKEGVWEWLDRFPTRSRLVIYLIEAAVGIVVAILVTGVIRR